MATPRIPLRPAPPYHFRGAFDKAAVGGYRAGTRRCPPSCRRKLELELEVRLAEVELRRLRLRVVIEDGLDVLLARLAVGRRVPHQLHRLAGLDALADVEEAVLFSVFGNEDLLDFRLRGV